MSRIVWDVMTERFYETGVDRCVLYAPSQPGVPWNGIISISENPTGGDSQPLYIDAIKYSNMSSAEEFAGTITAFSAPPEFAPCDGILHSQNGLFVPHQRRSSFGLSYRSNIGRGVDGANYGYKINLVYGATASAATRNNKTMTNDPSPQEISWNFSTLPPVTPGYRRTGHFVIDSRFTPPELLSDVEDILYGTEADAPRLPSPTELLTLFDG